MSSTVRTARHRHAADGGYPRGEETRTRILNAAMQLFAEHGFEGASTRDIATRAGVNAPALQYYFDNKEGVYLACAERIVSHVWERMTGVVENAERLLAGQADDEALIDAYCAIQAQTASLMFEPQNTDKWQLFLAREQVGMGPAAGFEIVYQAVSKRLYAVLAAIIERLLGKSAADETLIRTLALSGQLMFFQVLRRTALTALNWDVVNAERLALLKRVIGEQTAALLRAMTAARRAEAGSALR